LSKSHTTTWPFYYGWMIVALALLSMGFWAGLRATFAVFYVALLDEFSWSRGGAAGGQSVAYVIYIILAPLVGGLIDRFGPRRVIVPGILLLSMGLVLSSYTNSLVQFYFFYGVVASGITFTGLQDLSLIRPKVINGPFFLLAPWVYCQASLSGSLRLGRYALQRD